MIPTGPSLAAFERTGVAMWLVHLAMSLTFVAILSGFYSRLGRPIAKWLMYFFISRTAYSLALLVFWATQPLPTSAMIVLAIVMGTSLAIEVPQLYAVMRTLSQAPPPATRTYWLFAMAGAVYGLGSYLSIFLGDGSEGTLVIAFRPLSLTWTLGMVYVAFRKTTVVPLQRPAVRFLQIGVVSLFVCLTVESVFRLMVGLTASSNLALTGTTVANLLGLLVMGIAALLAVIVDERHHLHELADQQAMLRRQHMEANRLESLGRMASGIAHDFNHVLAIASGALELVQHEWRAKPDVALADLDTIRQAADRGSRLTRRLMLVSRQQMEELETFVPSTIIASLTSLLAHAAGPGSRVESMLNNAWAVHMSPTHFEQMLLNLLLNALEATTSHAPVRVSLDDVDLTESRLLSHGRCAAGRWVRLVVADSGHGIAVNVLPHIFEPFASTKGDLGHGIGMMTIQHAAASANAQLHVMSAVGEGTRIEVWLPAVPPDHDRVPLAASA